MGDDDQALPELQVRLLGAFDVQVRGASVAPPGARRRALLALLALRANEVVAAERLVDGVWGDDPPASAVNLVHTYVSLWRRVLDDALGQGTGRRRLERVGAGYRLNLLPGELDLDESRRLTARGRSALEQGRFTDAVDWLSRARDLWRGEPLGDLRDQPLRGWLAPLQQERGALLDSWAEAHIAAGRGEVAVAPLQQALADDPLQEKVAALLMEALHTAGRSAEALSVFERTRTVLSDELGASPGVRLAETHLRVLRQEKTGSRPPRPPRSRPLPVWTDTFVGRSSEVAEVTELLGRHRLVTVTGPGGAGKTRLAVEVAKRLSAGRPEVAPCFVDATVLTRASQLPGRIAAELGVDLLADEGAEDALAGVLSGRDEVVVTDNLEHLPGAGPLLERLITAVPGLRLLATSRSPLGVGAEHRYPLRPLDVAGEDARDPAGPAPGPAVVLFAERASAVDPHFRRDDHAGVVTEICRRLDGLPLAIELAAGWCAMLSPESLLNRLDHALDLLVAGSGSGRPERHSTLRATVEWSYDLLDEPSQRALRRLSVFRGGCTLDAAAAVCGETDATVLPTVRGIVERGLLVTRPVDEGDPRFEMLFTVQEYARSRLTDDPSEEAACRARHTAYFLDAAEASAHGLAGAEQAHHLDVIQADRDNIYEAISTALLDGDVERAMATAAGLWRFWQLRSHLDEGRRLLQLLDEHAGPDVAPGVRGRCLLALGSVRYWQLAYDDALSCYERASQLFGVADDAAAQAEATYDRAFVLVLLDRVDEGGRAFADALARYRALGDDHGEANARGGLALCSFVAGDSERAVAMASDALAELTRVGDPFEIANARALLATTLRGAGRVDDAERVLLEAITAHAALGSAAGVAWGLADSAEIALARGNLPRAAVLAGAAAALDDSRHPRMPKHVLGLSDMRPRLHGDPSCVGEWERGFAMTTDEAVALAMATRGTA